MHQITLTFRSAVTPPPEPTSCTFHVHVKNHVVTFEAESNELACEWSTAIMDAIDLCPVSSTPFEAFVDRVLAAPPDSVAAVYESCPEAHCAYVPLTESLVSLTYGQISDTGFYDTFDVEALV